MILPKYHFDMVNPKEVLTFWFEELTREQHFKKDPKLDQLIQDRFESTLLKLAEGGGDPNWRSNLKDRLAEIIVLDQFSRNIFRDDKRAFAQDSLAVALTKEAVSGDNQENLSDIEKHFLYMPLMHSESLEDHELAVKLFTELGSELALDYEYRHKKIIERFGRYPHRNEILGRKSTPEEVEFLKQPGSSF